MIDIREVVTEGKRAGVTYFCMECEKRIGAKVQCRYEKSRGWGKPLDRFWKAHDECGLQELDARLEVVFPNHGEMEFIEACYQEDPKMSFGEIKKRWTGIQEMKKEFHD